MTAAPPAFHDRGKRFHIDSSGFRKWGANGKGATSPCVSYR